MSRISEHLEHMTDGRWHDNCSMCLRRRHYGGNGLSSEDEEVRQLEQRAERAEAERDHNQRVAAQMTDKLTEAEAELRRLREALEDIDYVWNSGVDPDTAQGPDPYHFSRDEVDGFIGATARAALLAPECVTCGKRHWGFCEGTAQPLTEAEQR